MSGMPFNYGQAENAVLNDWNSWLWYYQEQVRLTDQSFSQGLLSFHARGSERRKKKYILLISFSVSLTFSFTVDTVTHAKYVIFLDKFSPSSLGSGKTNFDLVTPSFSFILEPWHFHPLLPLRWGDERPREWGLLTYKIIMEHSCLLHGRCVKNTGTGHSA